MIGVNDNLSKAALIVLAGSIALLAGAWAFQLIGGLAPCPMCLEQRWAYYTAIPVCLAIIALRTRSAATPIPRTAMVLCGLIILAGGILAGYHAGVEWKWWEGPTDCTGTGNFSSETSLLPDLSKPALVPCDQAAWRLFGISLAGYNFLFALALVSVCLWAVRNPAGVERA